MGRIGFMGENRKLYFVTRKDGKTQVPLPVYVLKNRKRHEYDPEQEAIFKQCLGCHKWFKVAEIGQNNKFEKVSHDRDFYRIPSGFRSYCEVCFHKKKPAKSTAASQSSFSDKAEKKKKSSNDEKAKYSVFMSEENHKYLGVRARLEQRLIGEVLDDILDRERRNHKLY